MGMREFSQHILAVANDNNLKVTNLQLQKIMYFVLREARNKELLSEKEIEEVYDESFLVWRYGPVIESIYEKYSRFGASPIEEEGTRIDRYTILNSIILNYINRNVFDLVKESHLNLFWKENEKNIIYAKTNIEYDITDIFK